MLKHREKVDMFFCSLNRYPINNIGRFLSEHIIAYSTLIHRQVSQFESGNCFLRQYLFQDGFGYTFYLKGFLKIAIVRKFQFFRDSIGRFSSVHAPIVTKTTKKIKGILVFLPLRCLYWRIVCKINWIYFNRHENVP